MIGKAMRRVAVAVFVAIGAATVLAVGFVLRGGVSARPEPSTAEAILARRLRHWAIPRDERDRLNPLPATPQNVAEGRAHFTDHCALCHANDGTGGTEIGRGLYPRAPDMRRPQTQSLSDGEIFTIIKNGVRFTGMPAWGSDDPGNDEATWKLVQFIRHLPALTAAELREMQALNPKSPSEAAEEREEREFLEGR
jgi:mono/diheme cytochrome c family protein